jgi:hypothetical protein
MQLAELAKQNPRFEKIAEQLPQDLCAEDLLLDYISPEEIIDSVTDVTIKALALVFLRRLDYEGRKVLIKPIPEGDIDIRKYKYRILPTSGSSVTYGFRSPRQPIAEFVDHALSWDLSGTKLLLLDLVHLRLYRPRLATAAQAGQPSELTPIYFEIE